MFIRIDFQLTGDEFARGVVSGFLPSYRRGQVLGLLLLPVAATLGYLCFERGADAPWVMWSLAWGLSVYAVNLIFTPWRRRRGLRRNYQKREIRGSSVVFTDEGADWRFLIEHGERRDMLRWAAYTQLRETPEFFLIYMNRRFVNVVPKRVFTPADSALFSRFVEFGFAQVRSAAPPAASVQAGRV